MDIKRRQLLKNTGLAGLGLLGVSLASRGDACEEATPPQMTGPYYPEPGREWEDEDLTRRRGVSDTARGTPMIVRGVVSGGAGCSPLANCLVEIWQADENGRYNHTGDTGSIPLDPNFQYWGRMYTDAQGRYSFRTIKPGQYPGRTPHIHFRVVAADGTSLVTQLYFADQARANSRDGIYRDLQARGVSDRVTTRLVANGSAVLEGRFDISLGEDAERTPFID